MSEPDHDLGPALRDLALLLPERTDDVRQMVEQWQSRSVRVAVLGEAKRGKSSLINALLGRDVLPTGVIPVTSVETEVRTGSVDSAVVTFTGGRQQGIDPREVVEFVSELRNPGNRLHVRSVEVVVSGTAFPESSVLVDTPGTGSVEENHDLVAEMASGRMDVALFVLASDTPLSAREVELLGRAAELSVALMIVVTKSDLLTPDELTTVLEYTEREAARAAGRPIDVLAESARQVSDFDLDTIRDRLIDMAANRAGETLSRSLYRRADRLIGNELDEIALADSFAAMSSEEATERSVQFRAALAATSHEVAGLAEVISAGVRRLNRDLDETREKRVTSVAAQLRERVDPLIERWMQGVDGQDDAITALTTEATRLAEEWRQETSVMVIEALTDIARRASKMAESSLSELRETAQSVLGVTLSAAAAPIELPAERTFFYIEDSTVDVAAALVNLARARLPRGMRRKAATARLQQVCGELADRQLGRARGDIRTRTSEAERSLIAQVDATVHGLLDNLQRAVDTAADLARERSAESTARRSALHERRASLESVRARLGGSGVEDRSTGKRAQPIPAAAPHFPSTQEM